MSNPFKNLTNWSREAWLTIAGAVLLSLFIILTFYFSATLWLYLVFLLPIGLIIMLAPEVGIYLVILGTIIFERWFTLNQLVWGEQLIKFYPLDVLLIFIFLSWFLARHLRHEPVVWGTEFGGSLWLIVILASIYYIASFFTANVDAELSFSVWKNLAFYFLVYFLVINVIKTPAQFNRLIKVFVAAGVGLVFFVLSGLLTGQGWWAEYVPLSTAGSRLLGGPHAFYVTVLLIMLINFLVWERRSSRRDILYLFLVAIFLLGLIGSLQRHLWLGAILAFAVLLYFYNWSQRKNLLKITAWAFWIFLLVVLLSFWLYSWQATNFLLDNDLVQSLKFRLFSLVADNGSDSSALWRLATWHQAWQDFQINWWHGVGLGQVMKLEIGNLEFVVPARDFHNDLVAVAWQFGLGGVLAIIYFVVNLFRAFVKNYQRLPGAGQKYYLGFFALLLLFLWSANFGTYFDINLLVIFFWLFLAGMTLASRLKLKD